MGIGSHSQSIHVKDISRTNCKGIVAGSLEEVKVKSAEKYGKKEVPNIHLDFDGTEIDDEDYFQTLEPNTELVAVFSGEQWIDPTRYVTITTRRNSPDTTDSAAVEHVNLKKIVSQIKSNLYNVSVLSEPDLEMITNMDPNMVADVTGKDFMEQLKEVSGRFLHEKREALDSIELLKLFTKERGMNIDIDSDEQNPTHLSHENHTHHSQQQQDTQPLNVTVNAPSTRESNLPSPSDGRSLTNNIDIDNNANVNLVSIQSTKEEDI